MKDLAYSGTTEVMKTAVMLLEIKIEFTPNKFVNLRFTILA